MVPNSDRNPELWCDRRLRWLCAGLCSLLACSADPTGTAPASRTAQTSAAGVGAVALGGDMSGASRDAAGNAAPLLPPAGTSTIPSVATAAGSGASSCATVQADATERLLPSDIIWAIDTSGSMVASFPAIQSALNRFSERIIAAGIDAHIVLLAGAGLCVPEPLGSGMACGAGGPGGALGLGGLGGPPVELADSKAPNFLHLGVSFGSSLGMSTLLDNHPYYKQLLRPNARVQLVLTEDGVPPMSAEAVTAHVEGRASATASQAWQPPLQPGAYVWNGVVCSTGSLPCAGPLGPPATTLQLIADTMGVVADLEQASIGGDPFSELLDKLAMSVIVGAAVGCEYTIPAPPVGQTFNRDMVNVVYGSSGRMEVTFPRVSTSDQCQDRQAWAYDDPANPRAVRLCPAACSAVQADAAAKVRVGFGCDTQLAPE